MSRPRVPVSTRVLRIMGGPLMVCILCGPLQLALTVVAGHGPHGRVVSTTDTRTLVDVGDRTARAYAATEPGVYVGVRGQLSYDVQQAPFGLWLLDRLPSLLLAATLSLVGLQLFRVLADTDLGRPFSDAAVRRLRLTAASIAVAGIAVPLLRAVADDRVATLARPQHSPNVFVLWQPLTTTLPWLLVAGLVVVLTEVFRIGQRLSDDVAGLV